MVKTVLRIDGMACSNCEAHVNKAISAAFDIKKIVSSHKKGETVITSDAELNAAHLKQAVADAGYTVTAIESTVLRERKSLLDLLK